ncbi:zinc-ribbon domain-containing protein [Mesoterricola sediminis]|uniref:Zinc finger/thioredoxin putative domain-containing protein n=1 Tax=Mesoterricola sediminis TaxID=2927980 RepID=A0AA48GPX8_9BACT|nr:zinc-ribbon domain-containing protein [Mesoterricola sediminis]BDU75399.1 hypothetical protein METESE_03570 [Mesoterricola sediminis]
MTETIRCPGCSTRFALRPGRVRAGIRRAKCFRCGTVFDIAETVERLLAVPALAPADAPFDAPLADLHVAPPVPEAPLDLPVLPPEPIAMPASLQTANLEQSPFEAFDAAPPSLTLGDLEGADEEIMEKTLVILPPASEAPEPADPGASGFTSAKDAIAKLMGDAPAPAAPSERRLLGSRNPMDVEATLSALETTLGGVQAPPPAPLAPPPPPSASTLKLSAAEIQAAIGSAPTRLPEFAAPAPAPLGPPPVSRPAAPAPTADHLKVQLEQETLENQTIDQVIRMVEQGRIQAYHMVARQFSDNWIEAVKVPALRPVFERRRREEIGLSSDPVHPPELTSPKRSLFGGLFGRN